MNISAQDIAKLRAQTGAGMIDCKVALEESRGDFAAAVKYLREKGATYAAKRAGKVAAEGAIVSYIHGEGKIGVLVEVNSETDFVAKNESFKKLAADLAMHIAAAAPRYLSPADVPEAESQVGAEVEVLGPEMSADDLADHARTNAYEVMTALGQRYARLYVDNPESAA